MQEASKSKLNDGTEYGWATENDDQKGFTVTVTIANWALSRTYDVELSSTDVSLEAASMAKALMVTIQGTE